MTKTIYQEIAARFPSPSQNNSRSIVRGIVGRANDRPSDSRMQEIERDFGFPSDWRDEDYGEEKKITNDN